MLTLQEAVHWLQVGFLIAVGFGAARLLWFLLWHVWDALTDADVKAYIKQFGQFDDHSNE
jgi:hypothetical protein